MSALVPIPVPGTDRQIMAIEVDGKPHVSLRHACEAIGIDLVGNFRRIFAILSVSFSNMPGQRPTRTFSRTTLDLRTPTQYLLTHDREEETHLARAEGASREGRPLADLAR